VRQCFLKFLPLILALAIFGCGNSTLNQVSGLQGNNPIPEQPIIIIPPDVGTAFVRAAHMSPTAGILSLVVDGQQVQGSLSYEAVTDYVEIPAGSFDVVIRDAGSNDVATLTVNIQENSYNTVTAFDQSGQTALGIGILTDDVTRVASRAKYRFVNATATVGPIKVVAVRADASEIELTGLLGSELTSESRELDVADFVGVRRIELRDVNDTVIAIFSDARAITAAMLASFNSWNPTQGVVATFFLSGTTMPNFDLVLVGAVDDANAGGTTIVGDAAKPR
jgi:hypothetical protein